MARTVEECLALASASRTAAAAETLENVRRVHLEAAASWESLAQSARYVEFPCEQSVSPQQSYAHPPANRLDRDVSHKPAVAPPPSKGEAQIGDALVTDGEADVVQREAAGVISPPDNSAIALYDTEGNLRTLEEIEADVIRLAIDVYRGRMAEVARRLGIGRSTL